MYVRTYVYICMYVYMYREPVYLTSLVRTRNSTEIVYKVNIYTISTSGVFTYASHLLATVHVAVVHGTTELLNIDSGPAPSGGPRGRCAAWRRVPVGLIPHEQPAAVTAVSSISWLRLTFQTATNAII